MDSIVNINLKIVTGNFEYKNRKNIKKNGEWYLSDQNKKLQKL